jgi:hypothetical protein
MSGMFLTKEELVSLTARKLKGQQMSSFAKLDWRSSSTRLAIQ